MIEIPTERHPVAIHQGDSIELLTELPPGRVDVVLTDPPFGIRLSNHARRSDRAGPVRRRARSWAMSGDDSLDVALQVIRWADGRGLPLILFASPYNPLPGNWRNVLVWDKGPAVGGGGDPRTCWKRTFEMVYTRRNRALEGGRDEGVLRFPVNSRGDYEYHPCQKPVGLLRYLLRKATRPGDVVLDPFAGSGSTAVACVLEGRRCVLVEREPSYVEVARRRVAEAIQSRLQENVP